MTVAVVKVIFDTNILVSGHFWKGPPYRCLLAAEAGLAVLVLSDPIVSELRESSPTSSPMRSSIDSAHTPNAFLCRDGQAGFSRMLTTTSSSMRHCQPEQQSSCRVIVICSHSAQWRGSRLSRPVSSSIVSQLSVQKYLETGVNSSG